MRTAGVLGLLGGAAIGLVVHEALARVLGQAPPTTGTLRPDTVSALVHVVDDFAAVALD